MKKLTLNEFIEKSLKIHNFKYSYPKAVYVNNYTKLIITCPVHGDFELKPNAHMRGLGCPKCYGLNKTNQDFINLANKVHNNKYDYSKVDYTTNLTKVCIICPKHGEFWQTPNNHVSKHRGCPKCSSSIGENIIENYLIEHNISYIRQYCIEVDKIINSSGKAYIDFYLPDYNVFIEYNGELHYKPIHHFGGELRFVRLQNRDNYIKQYCKENSIKLITVKYSLSINKIKTCINSELSYFC